MKNHKKMMRRTKKTAQKGTLERGRDLLTSLKRVAFIENKDTGNQCRSPNRTERVKVFVFSTKCAHI